MPAVSRTIILTSSHNPRVILRSSPRSLSTSIKTSYTARESQFRRSDFDGQGYTAPYEPGQPTGGPLDTASKHGAPKLTPVLLKAHLDKFVVGQEKAKKVTSVAIYNHYQRIRELRRLDDEEQGRREQMARRHLHEREKRSHPIENEFPGHVQTVDLNAPLVEEAPELGSLPLEDNSPTVIEKSNLMLLGPSGVGKTYILQTLAKVLEVPFAMVDCSSLTQAGYIGTDVESSIERLLLAANHDVAKTETGIIFFDEVDKLAKPAVMTHGRDVSGEGVQQGLLKIIEGTTVSINAKSDRSSSSGSGGRGSGDRTGSQRESGANIPGKSEQYTIDTTNILFVFAGAFVGLEKIITSRLSSGTSIGFGAQLRSSDPPPTGSTSKKPTSASSKTLIENPLEQIHSTDLQTYGLIPELLGRIPIITSLHPLSLPQLVSILTEPKNSLVKQYTALFKTYSIQLRFTRLALEAIASRAMSSSSGKARDSASSKEKLGNGLGARGLRAVMESVLGEIMFWGPGSAVRFVLIDEAFIRGHESGAATTTTQKKKDVEGVGGGGVNAQMPRCWSRGQGHLFSAEWEKEEEEWRRREEERHRGEAEADTAVVRSFERFREVGSSGM